MVIPEDPLDWNTLVTSYRAGDLPRSAVFAVLLGHADDPGWDSLADQLTQQEQLDFQQWIHQQFRYLGRRSGWTEHDQIKLVRLKSRFEHRRWPIQELTAHCDRLRGKTSPTISISRGSIYRWVFRVVVGAISIWFSLHLLNNRPWQIGDGECCNLSALWHSRIYSILGICLVVCPFRKILSYVCLVGVAALPLTYLAALAHWQSGNDGGGFCWLLIVRPACFVACILYGGTAAIVLIGGNDENSFGK